ncbi:hypothetical protein J6590_018568 [Homalodisca vitripennis]|nr:hypothetical protein J6590_018568 [Homalodisca vitripennis]
MAVVDCLSSALQHLSLPSSSKGIVQQKSIGKCALYVETIMSDGVACEWCRKPKMLANTHNNHRMASALTFLKLILGFEIRPSLNFLSDSTTAHKDLPQKGSGLRRYIPIYIYNAIDDHQLNKRRLSLQRPLQPGHSAAEDSSGYSDVQLYVAAEQKNKSAFTVCSDVHALVAH